MQNKQRNLGDISRGQSSLRFRRWSRKASAVFHSLHASVGIGRLSTAIIRRLERKTSKLQGTLSHLLTRPFGTKLDKDKEELEQKREALARLSQALLKALGLRALSLATSTQSSSQVEGISATKTIKTAPSRDSEMRLSFGAFLMAYSCLSHDYLND